MRIGVVSDIHSNIVAFEAVLDALRPVDQIWCLGDIVGYGPRPNECVARLAAEPKHLAVIGNHDAAAIGTMGTEEFNPVAALAAAWTQRTLTEDTRAYLAGLPTTLTSGEFTLAHGTPADPLREYLLGPDVAARSFGDFAGPFCLVGHTHLPSFARCSADGAVELFQVVGDRTLALDEPGTRFILNPGSVGQPRDDDPRASLLLVDTDTASASWRRVPYDIAATQEQMRQADLPARLIERLAHGW